MRIVTQVVPVGFTLFCLPFFFNFPTASISLRITKRFRGCEVSSEDVNKKITITEWTKTYDAMIIDL